MDNIYGLYDLFKVPEDTDKRNEEVAVNNYDKAVIRYQYLERDLSNYLIVDQVFEKIISNIEEIKKSKENKYKEIYVIFDVMYTLELMNILLNYKENNLKEEDSYILEDFFIEVLKHQEFKLLNVTACIEEGKKPLIKVSVIYKIHQ